MVLGHLKDSSCPNEKMTESTAITQVELESLTVSVNFVSLQEVLKSDLDALQGA